MKSKKLFGTDGIRGVANVFPIEPLTLVKVGKAMVTLLREELNHTKTIKVVIGRDTRISGPMIESALSAGICSQGGLVRLAGEIPTPGVAFITFGMRADAGIVISASHNSYQDNGIKIFSPEGYKIPDDWERKIEAMVETQNFSEPAPTGAKVGEAEQIADASGRYVEFLKNTFPKKQTLKGLKIVLDCAHGAAYKVAPLVFEELDADLIILNNEPNGKNINDRCGALHPERLQKVVLEEKADIGIALDGDADRLILVDEKGEVRDGDFVMAICGLELSRKGKLSKNTVVSTQMSNFGLEQLFHREKIGLIRTDVGDRYVVEAMRQQGYNFGGEQCGHLVFLDFNSTGDGLVSALQLLAVLQRNGKSLYELSQVMHKVPQVLLNISVSHKSPLESLKAYEKIQAVQQKLLHRGRILVRYSGTENLVRVMVEGECLKEIELLALDVAESLKRELG
ncbi:MAG: phosphoglucosamine mutase [Deltaproteobacteria bacterium]|nr:phosphoglucosamine mutase [Deltaproteobacteria bacterium]